MISSFIAEVRSLGGVTQTNLISPKGLYSRPMNEDSLTLDVLSSHSHAAVLPLQKTIDLRDGDVCVTDDKSIITLSYQDGNITIISNNVNIRCHTFSVSAEKIQFKSPVFTNNGVPVGSTHVHEQTPGGAGTPTKTPS